MMGEKKINIAELAREIEVNRSTITLLYYEEAKRVEMEVLEKLCVYFDCTIADLLEFKKPS